MNARSMTRTATMVAMTLTMATMATSVDAAPRGRVTERVRDNKAVTCRPVASYPMAAWVAPMAVVLTSPEAWSQWNREQVDAGRAVAEEALPQGVDWTSEVVLVLAMGEVAEAHEVEVSGARRIANATELSLHIVTGSGGRCPALVVALDRSSCRNLKLMADYTLDGVPTQPGTYDPTGSLASIAGDENGLSLMTSLAPVKAASATSPGGVKRTSWGAVKADYR